MPRVGINLKKGVGGVVARGGGVSHGGGVARGGGLPQCGGAEGHLLAEVRDEEPVNPHGHGLTTGVPGDLVHQVPEVPLRLLQARARLLQERARLLHKLAPVLARLAFDRRLDTRHERGREDGCRDVRGGLVVYQERVQLPEILSVPGEHPVLQGAQDRVNTRPAHVRNVHLRNVHLVDVLAAAPRGERHHKDTKCPEHSDSYSDGGDHRG